MEPKDAGNAPIFLGDTDEVAVNPFLGFGLHDFTGAIFPVDIHIRIYAAARPDAPSFTVLIFDLAEADILVSLVTFIDWLAGIFLFLAGVINGLGTMGLRDRSVDGF